VHYFAYFLHNSVQCTGVQQCLQWSRTIKSHIMIVGSKQGHTMSGFDFRLLLFVSTFNQLLEVPFLDDILPSEAAVSCTYLDVVRHEVVCLDSGEQEVQRSLNLDCLLSVSHRIAPSIFHLGFGFCVNVLLNRSDVDFFLLRKVLLLCMFIHV
jgi:hypothetical protein